MSGALTSNVNRALRFATLLDPEVARIKCISYMNLQAPFGGKTQVMVYTEFREYVLRTYTDLKMILINVDA